MELWIKRIMILKGIKEELLDLVKLLGFFIVIDRIEDVDWVIIMSEREVGWYLIVEWRCLYVLIFYKI